MYGLDVPAAALIAGVGRIAGTTCLVVIVRLLWWESGHFGWVWRGLGVVLFYLLRCHFSFYICCRFQNDYTVKAGTYFPMTTKKQLRAQEVRSSISVFRL